MAKENSAQWFGTKELTLAIKRNPQHVITESRNFMTRGMAVYKRGIINSPWRVGGAGGGSPVRVKGPIRGNLRDTHGTEVNAFESRIFPTASYARYVHEGTKHMEARPWLDYVKRSMNPQIEDLYRNMLRGIMDGLAK